MQLLAHYASGESPGGVINTVELYSCETAKETEAIEVSSRVALAFGERDESREGVRIGRGTAPMHYANILDIQEIGLIARLQRAHLQTESELSQRMLTFSVRHRFVLGRLLGWAESLRGTPEHQEAESDSIWLPNGAGLVLNAMSRASSIAYNAGQGLQWAIDGNRSGAYLEEVPAGPGVIARAIDETGHCAIVLASSELYNSSDSLPSSNPRPFPEK